MIGLLVQETQGQNARDFLLEVVLGSRRDPNLRAVIHSGVGGMPEPFFLDRQDVDRGADAWTAEGGALEDRGSGTVTRQRPGRRASPRPGGERGP